MTDDTKRKTIREFFTVPRPVLHPRTVVVGGCLVFLGLLSSVAGELGAGALAAAAGAAILLLLPTRARAVPGEPMNEAQYLNLLRYPSARRSFEGRVDAEVIDGWLKDDLQRIQVRSSEALGLDETTRDPLCVVGPLYSETVTGIDPALVLRRRVADGYLYSTYSVSVFQFTDRFLAYYQVHLNLITGTTAAERMGELFYRDVVAVRTLTESTGVTLKSGDTLEGSTIFSLAAKGGERVQVILDAPAIRSGEQIRSLGEAAVDNIRAMVRQYKEVLPG